MHSSKATRRVYQESSVDDGLDLGLPTTSQLPFDGVTKLLLKMRYRAYPIFK